MNKRKLLSQLQNSSTNVKFTDFITMIKAFGFSPIRIAESHNIFEHKDVPEMVNIQNVKGNAKPYQVKQFLTLINKYNLKQEGSV